MLKKCITLSETLFHVEGLLCLIANSDNIISIGSVNQQSLLGLLGIAKDLTALKRELLSMLPVCLLEIDAKVVCIDPSENPSYII